RQVGAGGREDEEPDAVAVLAGDDGVGDERRAGGDGADAELADRDPGARRELEVLGEAAVEDEAPGGLARVLEAAGVAVGRKPSSSRTAGSIAPPRRHAPGVTFGPLTRISSLSSRGARRSAQPGGGRPMTPARGMGKCTEVASGAVSVEPQADT